MPLRDWMLILTIACIGGVWAAFAGSFPGTTVWIILLAPWVFMGVLHRPDWVLLLIIALIPFGPMSLQGPLSRAINFGLPALVFGSWAMRMAKEPRPVHGFPKELFRWFCLLVFWTAFTACFSAYPMAGLWQACLYGILVAALLAYWNLVTRRQLEAGLILAGAVLVLLSGVALHQAMTLGLKTIFFGHALGPERLSGVYHNPGPFGIMMCYGLIITASVFLLEVSRPPTLGRLFGVCGLALCLIGLAGALLVSFSRASYVYAAAALLTLAWGYRTLRWVLISGIGAALVSLIVLPLPSWVFFGLRVSSGVSFRDVLWRAGWDMMVANPWTGIGSGTGVFEAYRSFFIDTGAARGLAVTQAGAAHNIILTKGAELGVVGFVLLVAWHVMVLSRVPRALRAYRRGDWLAGTAAAGVVGITARGVFENGGTLYSGHLDDALLLCLFTLVLYSVDRRDQWGPPVGTSSPDRA